VRERRVKERCRRGRKTAVEVRLSGKGKGRK
jgi:hypothetical protein